MIPVPLFPNETVAVVGLARSGLSAARSLKAGGARVIAWDDQEKGRALAEAELAPEAAAEEEEDRFAETLATGMALLDAETAKLASRHVSLGNMAGEGWFLTGEMVKLIDEGVEAWAKKL